MVVSLSLNDLEFLRQPTVAPEWIRDLDEPCWRIREETSSLRLLSCCTSLCSTCRIKDAANRRTTSAFFPLSCVVSDVSCWEQHIHSLTRSLTAVEQIKSAMCFRLELNDEHYSLSLVRTLGSQAKKNKISCVSIDT